MNRLSLYGKMNVERHHYQCTLSHNNGRSDQPSQAGSWKPNPFYSLPPNTQYRISFPFYCLVLLLPPLADRISDNESSSSENVIRGEKEIEEDAFGLISMEKLFSFLVRKLDTSESTIVFNEEFCKESVKSSIKEFLSPSLPTFFLVERSMSRQVRMHFDTKRLFANIIPFI